VSNAANAGLANAPEIALRSALLCSDTHLSHHRPALTHAFLRWLKQETISASKKPEALIILGDLFDAWIGDDLLDCVGEANTACVSEVLETLRSIHAQGIAIHIAHGNRDFLIGKKLANQCGAYLLHDPSLLVIESGPRVALTHGDLLCTRDIGYQELRQTVRNPNWQADFLAKPLPARLAIAAELRAKSGMEKAEKAEDIMDVTIEEAQLLADRLGADILLHGHTHRPGASLMPNGKARWVLPDWDVDADGSLIRGGGLWVDSAGVRPVDCHDGFAASQ
jgi:UDP-2,3-diacylglucosamine hydrolase